MSGFSDYSILPDYFASEKEDIKKLNAVLKAETSVTESDSDEIVSSSDDEEVISQEKEPDVNKDIDSLNINFSLDSSYNDQVDSYISKINAIDVNKVLLLNKTQQMLLLEGIKKYEELLDECNTQIEAVGHSIKRFMRDIRLKTPTFFKFGMPFFKTKTGYSCPLNNDALKKKENGEVAIVDLPPLKFWLSDEKEILRKSVMEQSKQLLQSKKKKGANNEVVFPLSENNAPIDWLKISVQNLKGRHTDDECKAMWYSIVHPHLNNSPWGPKEVERLKELVIKHKYQDWEQIAEELKTNRSGYACFLYFQLHCQKNKGVRKWTPDDDKILLETVERCRIGSFIPWSKVSYYIKDWSKTQIYCRYNNSLCHRIKKGKFSREEDLLIAALVKKVGKNFAKISTFIPGRTSAQLRDRYNNSLRDARQSEFRMWTIEEDQQIIDFVKKYGTKKWSLLEKMFKDTTFRSRTNIRHRWAIIRKYINPETFEGDVNKIPRLKAKTKAKRVSSIMVRRMIQKLENMEENVQNPASMLSAAKNLGNAYDKDGISESFNKYFISSFYYLKSTSEYREIDLINSLFILMLLEAQINLTHVSNILLKYLDQIEHYINFGLKTVINQMQENPHEKLIHFFNKYWQNHYGTSVLTNLFPFPEKLATNKEFERALITLRSLIKYVYWTESNLDQFYTKKYGQFVHLAETTPHLVEFESKYEKLVVDTEIHLDEICTTKKCQDFYTQNVNTEPKIPQLKTTFKLRFLALFTIPNFKRYAEKILATTVDAVEEISFVDVKEVKEHESAKTEKKRGRPPKKLPGGRLKYPKNIKNKENKEDPLNEAMNSENDTSGVLIQEIKQEPGTACEEVKKVRGRPRKRLKLADQVARTNPARSCRATKEK